jgi:hypothetical protein
MLPAVVHDLEDRSMFEKVVWWTGKFLDESKRWERKRRSGDFWRKERVRSR